jgi:hypothetical protein
VNAKPLIAENVYHFWHSGEVNPEDGQEHDLSLRCWCEPHPHDFGADVAGRPILVVNHHQPRLWCCSTHRPSPARGARIYEKPQARIPGSPSLPQTPAAV